MLKCCLKTDTIQYNTIQYNKSIYNARMVSWRAESEAQKTVVGLNTEKIVSICDRKLGSLLIKLPEFKITKESLDPVRLQFKSLLSCNQQNGSVFSRHHSGEVPLQLSRLRRSSLALYCKAAATDAVVAALLRRRRH